MQFFSKRLTASVTALLLLGPAILPLEGANIWWAPPVGLNNLNVAGRWSTSPFPYNNFGAIPGPTDTAHFADNHPDPSTAYDPNSAPTPGMSFGQIDFQGNSGSYDMASMNFPISVALGVTQTGTMPAFMTISNVGVVTFSNNASTNTFNSASTMTYFVTGESAELVFLGNSGVGNGYSTVSLTNDATLLINNTATAATVVLNAITSDASSVIQLGPSATATTTLKFGQDNLSHNSPGSELDGIISGTGGITKQGTGTYNITNTNTYSGTTEVDSGTLFITGSGNISTTGPVVIKSPGTLDFSSQTGPIQIGPISDGGVAGGILNLPSVSLTTLSNIPFQTFSGVIEGSGEFIVNPAINCQLTLSGNSSTYTGGTVLTGNTGKLVIAGDASLGADSGALTIGSDGTTLLMNSNFTFNHPLHLNNYTLTIDTGTANVVWNSIIDSTGPSGGLNINGNGNLTITSSGSSYAGPTTISGVGMTLAAGANNAFSPNSPVIITSDESLNLLIPYTTTIYSLSSSSPSSVLALASSTGNGLTISGGAATTFAGQIQGGGVLSLDGGTALTISGNNTLFGGEMNLINGSLIANGSGNLPSSSGYNIQNASTLFNNGTNAIASLESVPPSSSATIDLGAAGSVLTINGAGSSSFPGQIINAGGLTLNNNEVLTLTGSGLNTYTGPTNLTVVSTLVAGGNNVFSQDSAVTLGTLCTLNNQSPYVNTIFSLASSVIAFPAVLNMGTGTPGSLTINGGASTTFAGTVQGTGTLILDGGTDLTLTGTTNTGFTGATHLVDGTLTAGGAGTLPANSIVTIYGSSELLNSQNNTIAGLNSASSLATVDLGVTPGILTVSGSSSSSYSGSIINSGGLTVTGGQQLTLKGNSLATYTGPTTISLASSLIAGANNSLPSASLITINDTSVLSNPSSYQNTIKGVASTSTTAVIDLGNGAPSKLTIDGGGTLSFAGILTGTGTLDLDNNTQLTLTGTNNNGFTGETLLTNGTLIAGGAGTLSSASSVILDNSSQLTNSGANTIAGLNSTSSTAEVDLGTFPSILTVSGNSLSFYSGKIINSGGLTVDSGQQLTLTGNGLAIYTGPTLVSNGSQLIAGNNNAFSSASAVTLDDTSILSNPSSFTNTIYSLTSTSQGSNVNLGFGTPSTLILDGLASTAFAGTITGTGNLTIDSGNSLAFTGAATGGNNYNGATQVDGTLIADGTNPNTLSQNSPVTLGTGATLNLSGQNNSLASLSGSDPTSQVILGNGTLTLTSFPPATTYAGTIGPFGDAGGLTLIGGNQLTLTGSNFYQGPTTITNGTLTLANATNVTIPTSSSVSLGAQGILQMATGNLINNLSGSTGSQIQLNNNFLAVNQTTPGTFSGNISGVGGTLVKAGNSTLVLNGVNSYTGGTLIIGGILQGDTRSLQGDIDVNGFSLVFDQTFNGTFNGNLFGAPPSSLTKENSGTVTINTPQSLFTGSTAINGGTLNLNSILGGNVAVNAGASLTGNGTVGGNLTINGGGTISPGNSIGTMVVNGNYVQMPNGIYIWEANSNGSADLVTAHGTASLAGTLQILLTGNFPINREYLVLHADGGVTGVFTNPPIPINSFIKAELIYDPNDVFFAVQTDISGIAVTYNQQQVATQIDNIENPTPDQEEFLNAFVTLTPEEALQALDSMSGDQFTYLTQMARFTSERFKNGIFNAVRNTILPCWSPVECEIIETWYQGSMSKFHSGGDENCAGIGGTGWDASLGAYMPIGNQLLIGIACNYERDYLSFHQGGHITRQTGQIAGYFVGRSESSYILAEAMFGVTTGHYSRPINIGTYQRIAKSNPRTSQGLFYGEIGMNYMFNCPWNFLVQPFFGLEYGHYDQNKIVESGAESLDITVQKANKITFDSFLGVHLTSAIECVDLSVDLAWQYRFDKPQRNIKNHYETFGDEFQIKGCELGRNGAIGNLRASYDISRYLNVYVDLSGETWEKWDSYGFDLGFNLRW